MSGITLMAGAVDVLGGSGGGGGGGGGGTPASFTVTASPTTVSNSREGLGNLNMGTSVTASKGAGGVGGFSKRWTQLSGSDIITPNQPAQYSTAFTARPETYGVFVSVWRMKVTDNGTGEEVFSNTVTLTATINEPSGGGGGDSEIFP